MEIQGVCCEEGGEWERQARVGNEREIYRRERKQAEGKWRQDYKWDWEKLEEMPTRIKKKSIHIRKEDRICAHIYGSMHIQNINHDFPLDFSL